MKRGDIYRTADRTAERGGKPGFHVIVSRTFIAGNDDVSTVVCAPVYGEILGIRSEVPLGPGDGLPRPCAIRCDFLMLMFKNRLTRFVCALRPEKMTELDRALRYALDLTG